MPLELDARLRAFAAVARHGSFSRAAEAILLSQPAVSRHIASLERELGIDLFERGWRRTALTAAGEVLADHVLRADALLAQGARSVHALSRGMAGHLAIATSGTPGNYVLPPLIAAFHDRHPAVTLDVRLGTSGQTLEAIRNHRAEVGFVGGMAIGPELTIRALLDDEIVIVGSASQFVAGEPITPRQVADLMWIEREEGSATRITTEAALSEIGYLPRRRLSLPAWEMVKLAVANGAGIAALSRRALEVELRAGTLVVLDLPGWDLRRHLSIVTATERPLTPAAEKFVELVGEVHAPGERHRGKP